MQNVQLHDVGKIKYAEALQLQEKYFNELVERKLQQQSNNNFHHLLLCEHFPVITVGKSGNSNNILFSEDYLKSQQVDLFYTNRGGDVTFHGLGQITGYPILDLDFFSSDLRKYMRDLEEVMIQTIAVFGIHGYRVEHATGVWVKSKLDGMEKKIAAMGVKTSRWVTMHGFALNVNVDTNYFKLINPCGFTDKGVTSIALETNENIDFETLKQILIQKFASVFNCNFFNI